MPEGINEGATPENDAGKDSNTPKPAPPKADGDKPLGPNGEKALRDEREARRDLEREVQALKQQQTDQLAAIAAALGIKAADAKSDDVVTRLQETVGELQRDSLVERTARKHGITDDDDLELLRSAKDEQSMERLASRLAAKADESAPGTPKPDLTQGGSGTPAPATTADQFAAVIEGALNT